ncbi:KLTH0B06182p [Lachancea thermotolerans CBS 6340]|uniref:KLTH0B06182p n=1 Tax=Lachancea thermotolerans (strain ATCC 56472 / CBS 6340 / NRRL Y-8284) TaxID=559295 RepID=C5DCV8_LACTC|nr:KLTH0B06182p [Lachancea thermotolerans CBS 6340]CAR21619.1 KLTH0B06182p [Lachancea thermotolerans CBS 6340]
MDEKVLVTGCNGFVALHVLDILLSEKFHVIGTVRTPEKANRVKESFKKLYPYANLEVEIVADITKKDAFDKIFQKYSDIQHVIHTAANVTFGNGGDRKETYLIPATEGTKNILESTYSLGKNVKKFVMTSSLASIMDRKHFGDPNFVHTESTWNPITWEEAENDDGNAYCASKKLSERLAWDFVKKHEKDIKFSLTTVCPPMIMGPQVFEWSLANETLNTSAEKVNSALKTTPDSKGPFDSSNGLSCDVRDVALLHMLPLRNEALAGQRLFPLNGTSLKQHNYEDARYTLQRILEILNKQFPEVRGKISAGADKSTLKTPDDLLYYNNDLTTKLTGVEFKPFEVTVHDAAKQILDYRAAHK